MEPKQSLPAREAERMMNLQDVILRAMAKSLTWIEAAEIAGMSVRNMRGCGRRVLALYQEKYPDFNCGIFRRNCGNRKASG